MIRVEKLGATRYGDALDRMRAHIAHRADGHREITDELWLTEHPPVFTLGFASRDEHVRDTGDIPVIATERGGQVTYHGPGQVVAYLLLDLRRRRLGVRDLVCKVEEGLIDCLAGYGLAGLRKPGAPGIYVRPRHATHQACVIPETGPETGTDSEAGHGADMELAKIASIGLKISRGLSWHGVALNGCMDLEPFRRIDPCGYPGLRMTDVCTEACTHIDTLAGDLPDRLAASLVAAIEG